MERRDWLTDQFEHQRTHLRAVAYRMLGSVSEAEDAVQETWVRLDRHDPGGVADLRGWLTVVIGRICLDMLRSRRSRREDWTGTWLPEPVVDERGPEEEAVLADSISLALLVVLETLTPAERLAFVLHDVFAVPFDEIAGIVERTPTATRQLASRARRRVRATAPDPDRDLAGQRRVVDAFLAAARSGNFDALVALLDPDVVFRTDGGRVRQLTRPPVLGAEAVAREVLAGGRAFAPLGRPAIVNGSAGIVVQLPGRRPIAVAGFTVVDGRIAAIDLVADPEKLRGVEVAEAPTPQPMESGEA